MKRPSRLLLLAISLCALLLLSSRPVEIRARQQQPAEQPLTNASVVKLVRAGFAEKTVIAIIGSRPSRFDLSPDRLIELKKSGVSEKIILAMLYRGDPQAAADEGWDDGEFFDFKMPRPSAGTDRPPAGGAQSRDELNIFGSSGGAKGRTRTSGGGSGGAESDTETVGSASVRILRPPVEAGGAGAPTLERTPTLTNESVVQLVEAGFSDGTIVRRIESSPADFDLSPAKLQELRRRRVTEPVINAMRAAMRDDAPGGGNSTGKPPGR